LNSKLTLLFELRLDWTGVSVVTSYIYGLGHKENLLLLVSKLSVVLTVTLNQIACLWERFIG